MESYLLKVVEQYLVVIANPLEAPSSRNGWETTQLVSMRYASSGAT